MHTGAIGATNFCGGNRSVKLSKTRLDRTDDIWSNVSKSDWRYTIFKTAINLMSRDKRCLFWFKVNDLFRERTLFTVATIFNLMYLCAIVCYNFYASIPHVCWDYGPRPPSMTRHNTYSHQLTTCRPRIFVSSACSCSLIIFPSTSYGSSFRGISARYRDRHVRN